MTLRTTSKTAAAALLAKAKIAAAPKKVELHQMHVDNLSLNDGSGYFGLILNKNKSGKAIRIADRFGFNRVYVAVGDVDNLISALTQLRDNGVATSVKEVAYDAPTAKQIAKLEKGTFTARKAA